MGILGEIIDQFSVNNGSLDSIKKISAKELFLHNKPNDAWISYRGKVYDVSNWFDHPGGSVIFTHAGFDCTDIFNAFHPVSTKQMLEKFEIGDLDDTIVPEGFYEHKLTPEKQKEFEKAYRNLRSHLVALGMYKPSLFFYAMRVSTNFMWVAFSIYCAVAYDSLLMHLIGAVALGIFWQQCAWLAHDFIHHQVFKNRAYGHLGGVFFLNFCKGFSSGWWKNKHNSHHAVTNIIATDGESCDGDPDTDTMPYLAWSLQMAEEAKSSTLGRFLVNWQPVLYLPLLCFARFVWLHQCWVYVFGGSGMRTVKYAAMDRERVNNPMSEKIAIILHYVWFFTILSYMPVLNAMLYLMIAQTTSGFLLAFVIALGHSGMKTYPSVERPDFWTIQVSGTRNIKTNILVDWFYGGLQYQIEHHLFPTIPRHNLPKVKVLVESFCKEHNVEYRETSCVDGLFEVISKLSEVSEDFIRNFPEM